MSYDKNSCVVYNYRMFLTFAISDIFTQISDSSGLLVRQKFEQYLQDILALPTAVFEGPSFGYNDTAVRACFDMVTYFYIKDYCEYSAFPL